MRIISYIMTLLTAIVLAACGGGGGSPGLSSGPVSAFTVIAPAAVTLQVGAFQQYSIVGGVKPYSAFSNDPAVAVGWIGGDDSLSVGTVVAGKATVTVADAKGTKFDIAVTSGSSTALFTTASSSLTIAPGAASAQTYIVGGGAAPYTATSNFPSVVSVAMNGNQMTITGLQISASSSSITIRDAAGATVTVAVTVGTVPLALNPATLTAPIGATFRSVITGGTPPYRTVVLDNCTTNAQIVQGNILQATTALACTGAAITVYDANNQTVSMTFTVSAGLVGLQLAPTTLTIPENANTPSLSLLVYGANGSIKVFSTNATMLAPQTPVSNGDGTYTITLVGGNTCTSAAVAGVDNTVPPDGDFTDLAGVPTLVAQPIADVAPVAAGVGDRTITITVLDATGRSGTGTLIVKDLGLGNVGGSGCP